MLFFFSSLSFLDLHFHVQMDVAVALTTLVLGLYLVETSIFRREVLKLFLDKQIFIVKFSFSILCEPETNFGKNDLTEISRISKNVLSASFFTSVLYFLPAVMAVFSLNQLICASGLARKRTSIRTVLLVSSLMILGFSIIDGGIWSPLLTPALSPWNCKNMLAMHSPSSFATIHL